MKRAVIIIVVILLAGAAGWYFFFKKEEKPVVLQTERPRYGYISKSVTATRVPRARWIRLPSARDYGDHSEHLYRF